MDQVAAQRRGHPGRAGEDEDILSVLSDPSRFQPAGHVPIARLLPADSPRVGGVRLDHVRMLADTDAPMPAIVVHRQTGRVIDGMHRLLAAQLRGQKAVEVAFFDGDEDQAFLVAVQTNVIHGLPLSLADREAAAARILSRHGHWSSRTIAAIAGLAPATVNAIRRREVADSTRSPSRLGRDGRLRPLTTAEGRRIASEVIARRPDASLREIAKEAGISTGTARDVRRRLARGENPVPDRMLDQQGHREHRAVPREAPVEARHAPTEPARDRATILRNLYNDPSLRFSQAGRTLLRWLEVRSLGPDGWEQLMEMAPPHTAYVIAELASLCAERWLVLAELLRNRATADGVDQP